MRFTNLASKVFICLSVFSISGFAFASSGDHDHQEFTQISSAKAHEQCKERIGLSSVASNKDWCLVLATIASKEWKIVSNTDTSQNALEVGDSLTIVSTGIIERPLEQDQSLKLLWIEHKKGANNRGQDLKLLSLPFQDIKVSEQKIILYAYFYSSADKPHIHGIELDFYKNDCANTGEEKCEEYEVKFEIFTVGGAAIDGTEINSRHHPRTNHRDSGTGNPL